jgi:hypothetical protein
MKIAVGSPPLEVRRWKSSAAATRTSDQYLGLARRFTVLCPDPWHYPRRPQDYDQVLTQLRKDSP